MDIGKRIKEIRKHSNMTQTEFGIKVGVKGNTIGNYELGLRNPSEAVLFSICREFNVNEDWLRTGEGEMFEKIPEEDEFFKAATELSKNNDKMAMQALIEYWKLDEESKKLFKNFILHIVDKSKE